MSRRIEIELTSQRSPEEWTWRAAGAKQPKGTLEASLLYSEAKAGDVVRAEADFEIEGITITQVWPPQRKRNEPTNRIAVVGSSKEQQLVTSQLVEKRDRPKGPRRDGAGRRDDSRGDNRDRPRRDARDGQSPRPGQQTRDGQSSRPGQQTRGGQPTRGAQSQRPGQTRTDRPQRDRPARPARPETPTFKKLVPKDDARKAVLESLSPEHRPIAEQVLRGGIPAVRQAIDGENTKAKAEGRPEVNAAALITMAEQLLPTLKAADWLDKAQAAKADVNEISVRDLRAVVSGADAVARTDEARILAAELREALERRTVETRDAWVKDITTSLDDGRVIRALRLSARPPDAQTKFPPELLDRLKTGAEEAMSPETAPDRWVTLLDAVGNSPVRRSVMPKGLPENPGDELLGAAKAAAGRIPALAKQLGVTMPPPPPVRRPLPPKPPSSAEKAAAPAADAPSADKLETPDKPEAPAVDEAPVIDESPAKDEAQLSAGASERAMHP